MKTRWYHASPRRHPVGTILSYTKTKKPYEGSMGHNVYLTSSEIPHSTIATRAVNEGWHIYEVEPLSRVHPGNWDDAVCDVARVLRYVTKANGGMKRRMRAYRGGRLDKFALLWTGSQVRDEDFDRCNGHGWSRQHELFGVRVEHARRDAEAAQERAARGKVHPSGDGA